MNSFICLSCLIPESSDEELAAVLVESSSLGAWLQPEEPGVLRAVIYLDPSASDAEAMLEEALRRIGGREMSRQMVADRDWLEQYRRSARPFAVGSRWWIDPRHDDAAGAPDGRVRLRIEPSTAFGSGSHESTQLILTALEELPVEDATVLDLGSGSGILALAADALGARWVVAVDIDPQAVWVARRTRDRQEWSSRVALVVGTAAAVVEGAFDVVVCNILTGVLVPLLPEIQRRLKPAGRAILAGMLETEVGAMSDALAASGLLVGREMSLGEWAALEVQRG